MRPMFCALLMSLRILMLFLALRPVILRGFIEPNSETKCESMAVFLYSLIGSIDFSVRMSE